MNTETTERKSHGRGWWVLVLVLSGLVSLTLNIWHAVAGPPVDGAAAELAHVASGPDSGRVILALIVGVLPFAMSAVMSHVFFDESPWQTKVLVAGLFMVALGMSMTSVYEMVEPVTGDPWRAAGMVAIIDVPPLLALGMLTWLGNRARAEAVAAAEAEADAVIARLRADAAPARAEAVRVESTPRTEPARAAEPTRIARPHEMPAPTAQPPRPALAARTDAPRETRTTARIEPARPEQTARTEPARAETPTARKAPSRWADLVTQEAEGDGATGSGRKTPKVAREHLVTDLAWEIRARGDQWKPDYTALMDRSGMGRRWCEAVVSEARRAAAAEEPSARTEPAPTAEGEPARLAS